jgi:hypothetical protein
MKTWQPFFIEDSKIPVWLSYVAPLNIGAITVFFLVFSRGKIDPISKRHETIHFQQTLETFVVGMMLIYLWDYLVGLWKYRQDWQGQNTTRGRPYQSAANKAYHRIRAEQEAYGNELDEGYLARRPRFSWIKKYKV